MALTDLQKLLAEALPTRKPEGIIGERTRSLTQSDREALAHVSEDGWRLTSLVVVKLRLQQLLKAHAGMTRLFAEHPEGFARVFEAYHAAVPMSDFFPEEEARRFSNWRDQHPELVASLIRDR